METQCVRKIVTKLLHIILIYLMHHSIPVRICHQGKIKGLYEPTRESIKGFVLICLKSNILQDVCVEGGGTVSSQLITARSTTWCQEVNRDSCSSKRCDHDVSSTTELHKQKSV